MASPAEDEGDSATDCECVCCGRRGSGGGGGAGRERRGSLWRVALAEALGAALLLLLTCLAAGCGAPAGGPLQRALTAGLSVALVVQCFDHISGAQVNPAVTLAALVSGRVGARRAACTVGAQLAGALLGAGLAAAVGGGAGACVSRVGAVGAGRAAALEALATAALALANCAAWDPRCAAHTDSWPLRVGFIVAVLTLIIAIDGTCTLPQGEATGASLNPARSLAPALWAAHWDHLWVYWAGPLGGAGAAAALYRAAWGPAARAPLPPPPGARRRGPAAARRPRRAPSTPPAPPAPSSLAHSERTRKSLPFNEKPSCSQLAA